MTFLGLFYLKKMYFPLVEKRMLRQSDFGTLDKMILALSPVSYTR